jgi:hypothetical protein
LPRLRGDQTELLARANSNFDKLNSYIDHLSEKEQILDFPTGTLNRDVLMHLHHWHLMFMEWYKVGMAGKQP